MFLNIIKKLDIHKGIRNYSNCQESEPKGPEVKTKTVPGPKSKELSSKLKLFQNVADIELFANYSNSRGNYLVDADGNTFLDVNMQGSRFPLGYNNKELENILPDCLPALINPISLSAFPGFCYPDRIGKLMKNISPKLPNICICPCESSAVEQGMKAMMIGYKMHERGKKVKRKTLKTALLNKPPGSPSISILSFTNSFHGTTLGALNVTHSNPWLKLDVPTLNWPIAIYPEYRYPLEENREYNDHQDNKALAMVEDLIVEWDKKDMPVAGIIIEPVQYATNNVASSHFFKSLEQISYKYGVYFMLDESKTCCGTTGRFWAYEHFCLKCPPELVTFGGKAQICGYMHSEDVNPRVKERLFNISTGSATKLYLIEAIIKQIEQHNLLHNVRTTGDILMKGLTELANKHEGLIHSVRGLGLYLAFDVQCENLRYDFMQKLRRRGILCGQCGNRGITIRPSLTFTKTHACIVLDKLEQLLKETDLIIPEVDSKNPTKVELPKAAKCVKKSKRICEKIKKEESKIKCPRHSLKKETVSSCPEKETKNIPSQKKPKEHIEPLPKKLQKCPRPKPTYVESKSTDSNCLKEITNECTYPKSESKKSLCPEVPKPCEPQSKTSYIPNTESKSSCCENNFSKEIKFNNPKQSDKKCLKDSLEDSPSFCEKNDTKEAPKKSIYNAKQNIKKLNCSKNQSQHEKQSPKTLKAKSLCEGKENVKKINCKKLKCNKEDSIKSQTSDKSTKKYLSEDKRKVGCNKDESGCRKDQMKTIQPSKKISKKSVCQGKQNIKKIDCSRNGSKRKDQLKNTEKISKESICEGKQNIKHLDCGNRKFEHKKVPSKSTEPSKHKLCEKFSSVTRQPTPKSTPSSKETTEPLGWIEQNKKCKKTIKIRKKCGTPLRKYTTMAIWDQVK